MEALALNQLQQVQQKPAHMKVAVSQERFSASYTRENGNRHESAAVTYEHTEIEIEFSTYSIEDIKRKAEKSGNEVDKITAGSAETAQLKAQIHEQVMKQVKDSLGIFFKENPEAAEEVSRGEIPDYFNVDNTARRILDIYFNHYSEGEDKEGFVERAKGIIEQAYGEVAGIVGDLPGIVLETREKVMEILDRFAAGEDISGFMSREIV